MFSLVFMDGDIIGHCDTERVGISSLRTNRIELYPKHTEVVIFEEGETWPNTKTNKYASKISETVTYEFRISDIALMNMGVTLNLASQESCENVAINILHWELPQFLDRDLVYEITKSIRKYNYYFNKDMAEHCVILRISFEAFRFKSLYGVYRYLDSKQFELSDKPEYNPE